MAVKKNDATLKSDTTLIEGDTHSVADFEPAAALADASGAIIETAITKAVDVTHASVDASPREGTSTVQNAIDWNDPKRVRPDAPDFTGQGVDRAVYGKATD